MLFRLISVYCLDLYQYTAYNHEYTMLYNRLNYYVKIKLKTLQAVG